MPTVDQMMAARAAGLNRTAMSGMPRGLPEPLTAGGPGYWADRNNAPVYSSSGLAHVADTPYIGQRGAINPATIPRAFAPTNPGSVDPMLGMALMAGGDGGMSRGAQAFLGQAFNPWAREDQGIDGTGAPRDQGAQINQLFALADQLGIDTSGYSRSVGGMGIRGERSGTNDAMALYDEVNKRTRDYVSVGGLAQGWAGGGANNSARTIYKEVDGQLLPVTRPTFRQRRTNNGFISREAITAMSLMLPAVGGWAGILGQGGAGTLNAGTGLGLTSSLPASAVNMGVNTLIQGRINPMSLLSLAGGGGQFQTPMSSFQGTLGTTGLGRTEFGRGTSLIRLLGSLAGRG
jgi:hypothetical protein